MSAIRRTGRGFWQRAGGGRWRAVVAAGALLGLAAALARKRTQSRRRERRRRAKAGEDRHIGFRWLRWEARLASEQDAEAVFRAVAGELGTRLGRRESAHVAAHLPLGLREIWDEEAAGRERAERVDRAALVARVQSRLGLERPQEAEYLLSVVLAWVKHLASEETSDVAAVLPVDIRQLWTEAQLPQVPPWQRLELHHGLPVRRAVPVRFLILEPGAPHAPEERDGELYELPVEGARTWRGNAAFRVARVEADGRPKIHLVHDPEREARFSGGLPSGFVLSVRQQGTGDLWRADVLGPDGRSAASSQGEDCDEAAERARAEALRRLDVASGYHPGHEEE